MEVKISQQLKRQISRIERYGYSSERSFVEDAIRHRILDLEREDFLSASRKVKKVLKDRGISESSILEDFDKAREKKL